MEQELKKYREKIASFIIEYLDGKEVEFLQVNYWGSDSIQRLKKYVLNGKLVRGSLILMSNHMFPEYDEENALKAAAAIELIHSSLLIHDDIMDRDNTRRGLPSIHYQYETLAEERDFHSPKHFGLSMGICVGDIAFFMAMELISSLKMDDKYKKEIDKVFFDTICKVGLAQMQDVNFEYLKNDVSETEILSVYRYKTAKYTFSLPLMVGALLSGQSDDIVQKLGLIGEDMGIVFQIKDDELGIFSNEAELGKSIGIDIRDNKKTIYRHYLLSNSTESELHVLHKIFGNPDIIESDVQLVRDMIISKGVRDSIISKIQSLESNSKKIIDELNISDDSKKILLSILYYNVNRKK
jgi:geranylgeranyl diphosphate synthase, type I